MKNNRFIFLLAALLLTVSGAMAQEAGFDLSSQRGEKSDVLPVPGAAVDHHGIVLNPTPQQFALTSSGQLDLSRGFRVKDVRGQLADALAFVPRAPKGVALTVDFGAAKLGKNAPAKSGAYRLAVGKSGISVVGFDALGAFYGVQTLRQLLASDAAKTGKLPYLNITDAPALPVRGVVEGFYGTPWSHAVRLSLLRFMGENKLNTYVYGPKDDPYHSSPNWRKPYPDKQAQQIKELVDAARKARVEFVWGIHPGKDIQWNEEDYKNLTHKFDLMYALGVRSFAIHFDDIEGEGTNPVRQVELLNRLNREFVQAKGDVTPLIVCPTDYSQMWANPKENGTLAIYGRTLDPSVRVFWTGAVVCSDLTPETLQFINSRIKRPALFWWNFPVTDYARHIVMQGPSYGLDTSLTDKDLCGLLTNPMEYGEASKLSLYGVADYTWNVSAYNAMDNWERGLAEIAPEAREAYRTFALHSCDTETGYRRDESWTTPTFRLADYTPARHDALKAELEAAAKAPAALRSQCRDGQLIKELSPWLTQFEKLTQRDLAALALLKAYHDGTSVADVWQAYTQNLMSAADADAYAAHKCGTLKLHPFYEHAMDDVAAALYRRLTGKVCTACRPIGTYATLRASQARRMLDGDLTTYYHSGQSQQTGDWYGLDMGSVRPLRHVVVMQGRNSVDDVDYFDHCVLECSADGKTWTALTDELTGVYEVRWQGDTTARYVRLRKLESAKKSWCAVRSFVAGDTAAPSADGNLASSVRQYGAATYAMQPGANACQLFQRLPCGGSVQLRQLDAKGKCLAQQPCTTNYLNLPLADGATQLEIVGETEVFEVMN